MWKKKRIFFSILQKKFSNLINIHIQNPKISPKNFRVISNMYFYFPKGLKTNIKDGSKVKTEIIANNIANPVKIPK